MQKIATYCTCLLITLMCINGSFGQVNNLTEQGDPLYVKVDKFEKLMRGNHWNEGAIMQYVIFPPAGLDRPIVGPQADCLDPTLEMLAPILIIIHSSDALTDTTFNRKILDPTRLVSDVSKM